MSSDSSPVRIALAITELDSGGAERAFVRLATGLDRTAWEPRVYCLSGRGELAQTLNAAGIEVIFLDAGGRFDLGVLGRLSRELRKFAPSVLQTFLHHANIAGRMSGRRAGVPVIVCGLRVAEQRSRWRLRLDRWTQRSVDAWVCVSESVKQFSQDVGGLPSDRLHVIPNGVDGELFAHAEPCDWTTLGLPADAETILVVGRLDEQKRPQLVYESSRRLFDEFPNLHLVYVGIGPQAETIRIVAAKHDVSDRVHVLGRRDDIPAMMKGSRVLLHLSAWEGAPNVILEACAAGLPVVASDIPGNREILGGGEWGTLVSEPNPESVASAIRHVLRDRDMILKMAHMSQVVLRERHTWSAMVESYSALYRSLLSGKPSTGSRGNHF